MLDLQFISDNRDAVAENIRSRNLTIDLDRLLALKEQRAELITKGDELRRERNEVNSSVKQSSGDEKTALIERGKQLRGEVNAVENEQKEIEEQISEIQLAIPNMTHPDAPIGAEADSREIKIVGEKPTFDFEPLDHVELCAKHDLLDLESGAKVSGHGFYFLKNEAVLLEHALVGYALETARQAGFTLYSTPDLARDEVLQGTGFSPRGEATQIYSVAGTDLSLIATAEITLGGSLKDEVLEVADLPVKRAGLSHCFRTEAGAHGKATRGIYRVHQFTKVELFAFTAPDLQVSGGVHDEILAIEEQIFQGLGVPYRVIDTATGDLGGSAYRKFDLEAWMPGRGEGGTWGEVTSTSNCTDYQARRLNIRCRKPDVKGTEFVHTLNGTAIATTRAMIAILENNQQADGSIVIPEVLRNRMGTDRIG